VEATFPEILLDRRLKLAAQNAAAASKTSKRVQFYFNLKDFSIHPLSHSAQVAAGAGNVFYDLRLPCSPFAEMARPAAATDSSHQTTRAIAADHLDQRGRRSPELHQKHLVSIMSEQMFSKPLNNAYACFLRKRAESSTCDIVRH